RRFRRIERNPYDIGTQEYAEVRRLAEQYQFFHWHIAFPSVFRYPAQGEAPHNSATGWCGGFEVILGNPPWERVQIEEQQFFASIDPIIAEAPAAKRKSMIRKLAEERPSLHIRYLAALRVASGTTHLARNSSNYPLTGSGNVQTHSLYTELAL